MLALLLTYLPDEYHQEFSEIYEKYRPTVRHIAFLHLGKKQDIEDSVQNTFEYIAKKYDEIREKDEEALKGYICAAAKGFAISCYRKRQNDENNSCAYMDTLTEKVSDETFDFFNNIDLQKALEQLKPEEQNIIELKFVYGMSSKDIGAVYGITPSNARKRLERAKAKVKKIIEKNAK